MNHCGTQFIETDRLILRKFSIDDAESMYRNWASDSEVTRYLTWPAHTSAEVSKAVLENWTASYAQKNYYQWAIILKKLWKRSDRKHWCSEYERRYFHGPYRLLYRKRLVASGNHVRGA